MKTFRDVLENKSESITEGQLLAEMNNGGPLGEALNVNKIKVDDKVTYLVWIDGSGYTDTKKGKVTSIDKLPKGVEVDGNYIPVELLG